MLTYKKSYENVFYLAFSFAVTVCPVASLLAWVIVSVLYCNKKAPVNDDVTKFLFYFSVDHSVIFVSIVAIILMALGVSL